MAMLQQHQQQSGGNPPQPQPQPLNQLALSNQQSQSSNHNIHQQDKLGGAGSITMDGSMSNSFRGNEQVCSYIPVSFPSSCFNDICSIRF